MKSLALRGSLLAVTLLLAVLFGSYSAQAQTTYTWTQTAGGEQSWDDVANWSAGIPSPVSGDTVDFSTVNIAAATTLLMGVDRTAEVWKFGDTASSYYNWTVTNNTITLAGTTPTIDVVNNTATIYSSLTGTAGLQKTGAGTLTLRSSNSFSGGVFINGGKLQLNTGSTSASLGDPANVVTFNGTSTFDVQQVNQTLSQGFAVNGVTATLAGNAGRTVTINNALTGSGTVKVQGSGTTLIYDFKSINNTFSGDIQVSSSSGGGQEMRMDSLADAPGSRLRLGNATRTGIFRYGTGAVVPLVLSNRQIELEGTTGGGTLNNYAPDANNIVTINRDLLISGVGAKTFTLGGTNTGTNTFAGVIPDGAGSVISLAKAGSGTWVLSGENTFSGTATVSDGTLVLAGSSCLSDTNALSIASGKKVQLEAGVQEKVGLLILNGITQADGIWGSTASGAPNNNDSCFSGTGLLYVNVDIPCGGTIFLFE